MSFSKKLKTIFWPISKSELGLFMPMALLMLCILLNFSVLRSVKDSLVVPSIGAEVISFLKLWLVLPTAVICTIIYVKLSNMIEMEYIFYIVVSSFLGVFIVFAFILYPNQEYYHPSQELIRALHDHFPYLKWFIKIFEKWSYALLYIFAELWSVVVINLMFWQFANHIIASNDAKRFYPTLGMVGNLGLILAGNIIVYFSDITGGNEEMWQRIFAGESYLASEVSLKLVVLVVFVSGIIAMLLLRYIHKVVLRKKLYTAHHDAYDTQTKLSVMESIKLITHSRYIGYIVVMIVCYGLAINILEGPWKAKVKELYPTTREYMEFMGNFNIYMGGSSVFFMLVGSNLLRKFSWFFSAIVTPSIIGITGTMFFVFVVFKEKFRVFLGGVEFDPIYAAVMVGALQNILSKSTKYSLFDSTKEMAYIPLSRELRTKGKAAAEIIGAKLGKSLGAFIQSTIFILVPVATFDSISPLLMVIFLVVVTLWLADVRKLEVKYNQIVGEK
jgi:ATP:ADP antiporter, AAA family